MKTSCSSLGTPPCSPTWSFPVGESLVLDNGVRVVMVDAPGRLLGAVGVAIDLPIDAEPSTQEGIVDAGATCLAARLRGDGARRLGPGTAASIGATFSVGADHRGPKLLADVPMQQMPALIELIATCLDAQGGGDDAAFAMWQLRRQTDLRQEQLDQTGLANKLFCESVLDPGSRHARPVGGTAQSIASLDAAAVSAYWAQKVCARRLVVIVVSDRHVVDVRRCVEAGFGRFEAGESSLSALAAPTRADEPQLILQTAQTPQTQLMIGHAGIDRHDPRWSVARLIGELLTGSADAVLNVELRERRRLSYGAAAQFVPYRKGGLFAISARVGAEAAAPAAEAICAVLEDLGRRRLPDRLLADTVARMQLAAPQVYESPLAIAQQYLELASDEMAASFVDDHLRRIARATPESVRTQAAQIIRPGALHVVAVGPFEAAGTRFAPASVTSFMASA